MLSILIPAYNYDVTKLVHDLHRQVSEIGIPFEIIVMEDGSTLFLDENQSVRSLPNCKYAPREKNMGRASVRNQLARSATFENLLFIDCDAEILQTNFISNYLPFLNKNMVVIGGTVYENCTDKAFSLRLAYGNKREASQKSEFTTFNALIPKNIFDTIRFDQSLTEYGHEDSLFGHELKRNGISIKRINNPLVHKGLDSNPIFLNKTRASCKNLLQIHETNKHPFFYQDSKLLQSFLFIKRIKGVHFAAFLFKHARVWMEKQLCGQKPNLVIFNLYKLGYICLFAEKKQDILSPFIDKSFPSH